VVQEPPAETKAVEDRPMIGTELVSLRSVKPKNGRYRNIWTLIGSSPDYDLWFGPSRLASKGYSEAIGHRPGLAALFFVILIGLVVDAQGDTESAWNPWNTTWMVVLCALLVVGAIYSVVGHVEETPGWRRHCFIVRLGGRADIGVGEMWQDTSNGVCILVAAMLPGYRRQKLGSIATRMMIRKSFTDLGARRVESSALSTNSPAIHMNDRMVLEGTLKGRWIIRGAPTDENLYRITKEEWLAQLNAPRGS
jgi:hypothetical protein